MSNHTVRDLVNVEEDLDEEHILACGPLLFVDTAGAHMYEAINAESVSESKYNVGECDLVISLVQELREAGLSDSAIGVITPYSAQVHEVKKDLRKLHEDQYT